MQAIKEWAPTTWPVRMAKDIYSAVTLPGDIATGKTDIQSPEAQRRAFDLAMTVLPGSPLAKSAGAAEKAATTAAKPVEKATAPIVKESASNKGLTLENILPTYRRLKEEQGGFSAVKIYDLEKQLGIPREDLHRFLLDETKSGRITIHPTTSETIQANKEINDASIRIPGFREPFITMAVKDKHEFADQAAKAAAKPAAKAIEEAFQPQSVGAAAVPKTPTAPASDAQALIRQRVGMAERDSAQAAAAVEPYERAINLLPEQERLGLYDYMEGRSKGAELSDKSLQPVADAMRTQFDLRKQKLQSFDKTEQMGFVQDYFPHMWENPKQAEEFVRTWTGGTGKEGSGAFTKKRTIPTISDGLAAGLKLKTSNPIEAMTAYTSNMDRYLAMREVVEIGKEQGTLKYFSPGKQPSDWVQLKGRAGYPTPGGKQLYAPAEWSRNYNNFISRGFEELDPRLGNVVDKARKASNFVTMAELSFSGFHAFTMAKEGIASEAARAAGLAASGRPLAAAKALGSAAVAPVKLARIGKKGEQIYLGLSDGTKANRDIVDLLTQANARMSGMDKTLRQSSNGSLFTSWRKASLGHELKDYGRRIGEAEGPIGKAKTTAGVALENMARVAETIQKPLFEHYIPMVKNGAAMETLRSWLELHPTASHAEKLEASRKIWDSIDNRFGEMVQDNIFAHQTMKQLGQLFMRSYSWNLGTLREIGGGVKDIVKNPKSISMASDKWSPRANYIFGMVLATGYASAVYQFLKTGEPPKDIHDLMAPRTGGVDADTGMPERLMIPGYDKDVYGWYENTPGQEAWAKMATLPRSAAELAMNKNWRGDPIMSPDKSQWLGNLWDYVTENFGPITLRSAKKGQKEGSAITPAETVMGLRPAPMYLTSPEDFEQRKNGPRGWATKAWQKKQKFEERQKRKYGGVD